MTLTFHYPPRPRPQPVVSLGGRFSRPRPMVPVTLIVPTRTKLVIALLDTGSDDTVFPESYATQLGIDLTNAPTGVGQGVGGTPIPLRYVNLTLRIADNNEQREWSAIVAFTPVREGYPSSASPASYNTSPRASTATSSSSS